MTVPWERRETAVSAGFDPASVTERAARRRTGDAGLGRPVVVPVYLRRRDPDESSTATTGLLVKLSPGGGIAVDRALLPPSVADRFWSAVHRGSREPGAITGREGWVRVRVDETAGWGTVTHLVLRDPDWRLLGDALLIREREASAPQDAPASRTLTRFLGRLDGFDGSPSAGLWGRLALEVVSVRHPDRLADTRALLWWASWGRGGFSAGSGGRTSGYAEQAMLMDLAQQRVRLEGRLFGVRTLPDWEREEAARDLGLPPLRVMAWPVSALPVLLAFFADISPAPWAPARTATPLQDAPGPQDDRRLNDRPGR